MTYEQKEAIAQKLMSLDLKTDGARAKRRLALKYLNDYQRLDNRPVAMIELAHHSLVMLGELHEMCLRGSAIRKAASVESIIREIEALVLADHPEVSHA